MFTTLQLLHKDDSLFPMTLECWVLERSFARKEYTETCHFDSLKKFTREWVWYCNLAASAATQQRSLRTEQTESLHLLVVRR